MNPNRRLNSSGIDKLIPFLEDVASIYEEYGGLEMSVYKGSLKVDNVTPALLIDEAHKEGVHLICTSLDHKHTYFDVYVEQEAPPIEPPTIIGTSAPGIETDVHKVEPVGAAAKNKMKVDGVWKRLPKGSTKEKQMLDTLLAAMDEKFAEKFEEFFKRLGGA